MITITKAKRKNETLYSMAVDCLKDNNKTHKNVLYVLSDKNTRVGKWQDFVRLSRKKISSAYDVKDIKIVGSNWWIELHNNGVDVWFEFKSLPKPLGNNKLKDIFSDEYYKNIKICAKHERNYKARMRKAKSIRRKKAKEYTKKIWESYAKIGLPSYIK